MTEKSKHETTIKRWIELPKSLADAIEEIATRERRSSKRQTEVLIAERVEELQKSAQGGA